jgi:EAL domain-containing protein (putative c-di-GMP-specific phosphodiesterase class I)
MLYISCSIGISIYPDDATNHKDLLKYADAAMYKAKEEGRNNFQFYQNEMTQIAFEKVILEAHLREALQNDDFVVYYQPQIDIKTQKLIGMEALVRWEHEKLGIVPPSKFISLAEATGLIVDLDRFVMRSAIKQFALWYKDGYNPGKLSLNLTVQQIHQTDFIVELQEMMDSVGFDINHLTLEVTETQIMKHPDETIKILEQISQLGISLAIDDFGVAYSSLSQLKKLPLDILKIDQSFIRGLPDSEQDISIAKAIIALAKSLDFKVLAEGVEHKNQRDFLLQEGCDVIQGYYYSRPITAKEIEDKFLKESV